MALNQQHEGRLIHKSLQLLVSSFKGQGVRIQGRWALPWQFPCPCQNQSFIILFARINFNSEGVNQPMWYVTTDCQLLLTKFGHGVKYFELNILDFFGQKRLCQNV